jgi:hypothetical protein
MSVYSGPEIINDGLVLCLDAANPKSFGPISVQALVVAGGGGGGAYAAGGGGGAGGVVYNSSVILNPVTAYTITVGNGGAGGIGQSGLASNGQNSVFATLTAIGGGAGGRGWTQTAGSSGGSGGGGGGYDGVSSQNTIAGGAGTTGQGNSGGLGRGISTNRGAGGGGGGAGGAGGNSTTTSGGDGGPGIANEISGSIVYYGGGGGAGDYQSSNGGTGGIGGGGDKSGGNSSGIPGGAGTPNTGGGGGGSRSATSDSWNGGNGGSGIVIIRYSGPQKATGGTITTVGSDTVHTFTSSGTFTTGTTWVNIFDNVNNGTLINGVSYDSNNNGSLVFDGTNDYVNIAQIPTFTLYCLEFWMYNNNAVPNNDGAIGGPSTYQSPINFNSVSTYGINLGGWTGGASNEAFHIWSATAGGLMTYNRTSAAVGWHYVAFNWNGTTYDIWLDGIKTTTYAHTSGHAKLATISSLRIGGDVSSGYYFNGRLSNVKCYNNQLTDSAIQQNFNATKSRYGL